MTTETRTPGTPLNPVNAVRNYPVLPFRGTGFLERGFGQGNSVTDFSDTTQKKDQ